MGGEASVASMTAKWLGVGLLTVTGLGAGASYVVYKQDQEVESNSIPCEIVLPELTTSLPT